MHKNLLNKHLLTQVNNAESILGKHQTCILVSLDAQGNQTKKQSRIENILKADDQNAVDLIENQDEFSDEEEEEDALEEFVTPGQNMADVVQQFIEENSRYFEDVLIDENQVSGKLKETDFQVVVRGSPLKDHNCQKAQELFNVCFIVYDNQMVGHIYKDKRRQLKYAKDPFSVYIQRFQLAKLYKKYVCDQVKEEIFEFI